MGMSNLLVVGGLGLWLLALSASTGVSSTVLLSPPSYSTPTMEALEQAPRTTRHSQRRRKLERKQQEQEQQQERRAQSLADLPGDCEMFFLLEYDVVSDLDSKDIRRVYAKDAYVQVAQLGRSEGRASIEETLSFFSSKSPFLQDAVYYSTIPIFSGFRSDGLCEFFFMYAARFQLAPQYIKKKQKKDGVYLEAPLATKLFYDPLQNQIRQIHLLVESSLLQFLFQSLDSDETTRLVCNVLMRPKCLPAATVSKVEDDPPKCWDKLSSLPLSDNSHSKEFLLDGNSRACRIFQTPLAATSAEECPHISLKKLPDENGHVKCRKSQDLAANQLFGPDEMQSWRDFQRISLGNLAKEGGFRFYGRLGKVCDFGKALTKKGKCRSSCKRQDGVRFDSRTFLCKPLADKDN